MTCVNTINRGFNYLLSFVGFVVVVWSLFLLIKSHFIMSTALGIMLATGILQCAACYLYAAKGHKLPFYISCYKFILGTLIFGNLVVIVLCLDKSWRKTIVEGTLAKTDPQTAQVLSDNILISGYIMISVTLLEAVSLILSIYRRKDIRSRKNEYDHDEDDVDAYYVQLSDSFDGSGSLNRKLILSDREEHGWLHKKGNDAFNAQWKKRWFVMEDDALAYYESPESKKAQGTIALQGLRCTRAEPEKRKVKSHPWTFKIYNPENPNARIYYLYASSSKKERTWLEWIMNGIDRANKLNMNYDDSTSTTVAPEHHPDNAEVNTHGDQTSSPKELLTSKKEKKSGWLHKKGENKFNAQWRKRWFSVNGGAVHYFTKPDMVKPNGTIDLKGMLVTRAEESKRKKSHPWTFKVFNPSAENSRVFYLYADSANKESSWIKWIREGINVANGNTATPRVENEEENVLVDLDAYENEADGDGKVDAAAGDDEAKGGEEFGESDMSRVGRQQNRSTLTNFALYQD